MTNPEIKTQKVPLYNPLNENFTVTYDLNGDKHPLSYTLHAHEIEYFESAAADHIAKHLANKVVRDRGVKTNYPDEYEKVLEEIFVTI